MWTCSPPPARSSSSSTWRRSTGYSARTSPAARCATSCAAWKLRWRGTPSPSRAGGSTSAPNTTTTTSRRKLRESRLQQHPRHAHGGRGDVQEASPEQAGRAPAQRGLPGRRLRRGHNLFLLRPPAGTLIRLPADSPLRDAIRIPEPLGEDTSCMGTTILPSMLEVLAPQLELPPTRTSGSTTSAASTKSAPTGSRTSRSSSPSAPTAGRRTSTP